LLLGLFSKYTNIPVEIEDASKLNTIINYFGIGLASALLLSCGLNSTALIVAVSLPLIDLQYHALSPHPGQLGITLFAMILPLSALAFEITASWTKRITWLLTGTVALAFAFLLREPIGFMGFVATVMTCGMYLWRHGASPRTIMAVTFMAVLAIAALLMPWAVLRVRDIVFNIPPTALTESHGIWHNLYLGLGLVSNPWGISWNDAYGIEVVKKIDPTIAYVSHDYFDALRNEYFRLVVQHPIDVVWIYAQKFVWTLGVVIPAPLSTPTIVALAVALLFAQAGRRRSGQIPTVDGALICALLFALAFIAQGVLINPSPQYSFPLGAIVIVIVASGVEYWRRWLVVRSRAATIQQY